MNDPADCARRPHGEWAVVAQRVGYPSRPVELAVTGEPLGEWQAGKPKLFRALWSSVSGQVVTADAVAELRAQQLAGSSSYIRWTWETGSGAREGVLVDSGGGSFVSPPTTTLKAELLGAADRTQWAVLSRNNTAQGVLLAGQPTTVEVATIWTSAAYDHEAAAGPCDCPSFTERRTLDSRQNTTQAFLRPPYARRVTVYGSAGVVWRWLDFTNPPTVGEVFPETQQQSVPGFVNGVAATIDEGMGLAVVVWDLQI